MTYKIDVWVLHARRIVGMPSGLLAECDPLVVFLVVSWGFLQSCLPPIIVIVASGSRRCLRWIL